MTAYPTLLTCFFAMALGLASLTGLAAQAETYYVDFAEGDNGNPGTTPGTAWKHAPGDPAAEGKAKDVQLAPGDIVQFKSGVIYRGNIVVPASGEKGNPITYQGTGWGEGRAIVDGSELVTGWKKCESKADAGGAEKFANLYYAFVDAASPFLLNLHETDPTPRPTPMSSCGSRRTPTPSIRSLMTAPNR